MAEKRKWWLLPLILLLTLTAGALFMRICSGLRVLTLFQRTLESEQMFVALHMDIPMEYDDGSISWDTLGEERYYTLNLGQESVYLHERELYFSTGNGYSIGGLLEDIPFSPDLIRFAVIAAPWERQSHNGCHEWTLSVPDEPGFLIRSLYPEVVAHWDPLRSLKITLLEESGKLKSVSIQHDALSASLELQPEKTDPVPTERIMRMGAEAVPDIRSMKPLALACLNLYQAESVLADLDIQVDCGPLPIQDTSKLRLSDRGLFIGRGDTWTELTSGSIDRRELVLGIGWFFLRNGTWQEENSDSGSLHLTLNASDIETTLLSLLPELDGLDLTLNDGELIIRIERNQFSGITLGCNGQFPLLIAQIPLSIHLELSINR